LHNMKSLATQMLRKKYEEENNFSVYGCTQERCEEIHIDYHAYINQLRTLQDFDRIPYKKGYFLFDPLTFAHFVKGRKIVLYNAIFDEIFPRKSSEQLWEEMGKSERHLLFSDHFTSIFYRNRILNRSIELTVKNK
jgi:hypothetical protein